MKDTHVTKEAITYVTTEFATFDCGTLLNTSTYKLSVICDDVAQWHVASREWQELAEWATRKVNEKTVRNYHPLRTIIPAAERNRFLEELAQAQDMSTVIGVLDALIGASRTSETVLRAASWIVGDLSARGLALAPCTLPNYVPWMSRSISVGEAHPWASLKVHTHPSYNRSRFLLNAMHLPTGGQFGTEFVEAVVACGQEWDATLKTAVALLLRTIAEETRSRDPGWIAPSLLYKVRLWAGRAKGLKDLDCWWIIDPEHGHPSFTIWRDDVAAWLCGLPYARLDKQTHAIRDFLKWNRSLATPLSGPSKVARHHVKRMADTLDNFTTFQEHLDQSQVPNSRKSADIGALKSFFDWWCDERALDLGLDAVRNPFLDTDLLRYKVPAKAAKSNKRVLPREMLAIAKEVNREGDYAFARSLKERAIYLCEARVFNQETQTWEDQFCPVLPTAMDVMLTLPIRTIQAMLLDSGEADEVVYDPTQDAFVPNDHPLAERGRRHGAIRKIATSLGPSVTGFHICTNKTELRGDGQAERGYDIPWNEPYLIGRLAELAAWQRQFNALRTTDNLLSRDQLRHQRYRHEGAATNLSRYAYLMRNPNSFEPASPENLADYWALLLLEVERRLKNKGVEVNLVEERRYSKNKSEWTRLAANYTLHGLRVAGITAFVEAGLPLHVLAEFVSGHATLLMVLHYTVSAPDKIHAAIDDAARMNQALEDDLRPLLERLRADAKEDDLGPLAEHFFGSDRAVRELVAHPFDLQEIMPDGICPVGGTMCHQAIKGDWKATKDYQWGSLQRDQYNCALCRFRVTGPAFLQGQVMVFNNLLYRIWTEAQCLQGIQREKEKVPEGGRADYHLQKRENALNDRIDHLFKVLSARMTEILQSKAMLDRGGALGSHDEEHALITRMTESDVEIALETDGHHWDLVEFAARSAEVFPAIAERDVSLRKGKILARMLKNNGVSDMLLELSDDEALRAGNKLTTLLQDRIRECRGTDGRQEMRALMDCTTTLAELGVAPDFSKIVREVCQMFPQPMGAPLLARPDADA